MVNKYILLVFLLCSIFITSFSSNPTRVPTSSPTYLNCFFNGQNVLTAQCTNAFGVVIANTPYSCNGIFTYQFGLNCQFSQCSCTNGVVITTLTIIIIVISVIGGISCCACCYLTRSKIIIQDSNSANAAIASQTVSPALVYQIPANVVKNPVQTRSVVYVDGASQLQNEAF